MNKFVFVFFTVFAATSGVRAQGIWIESGWTCADWAQARFDRNAYALEQHVVGTLNGIAIGAYRDFWREKTAIDSRQAFFWMDNFCEKNPLDKLLSGVFSLVSERLGGDWSVR